MQHVSIVSSVGQGGRNLPHDVEKIQGLLNKLTPSPNLAVSRQSDAPTLAAIHRFQASFLQHPDNRIDPGGRTLARLNVVVDLRSPVTHRVPIYTQATIQLCWEASARMLWHWEKGSLNGYEQAAGRYARLNQGLINVEMDRFYRQLGIQHTSPARGTDLLRLLENGPVIFTNQDRQFGHAMVAIGYDLAQASYVLNNPCAVMAVDFENSSDSCQGSVVNLSFLTLERRLGPYLWYW